MKILKGDKVKVIIGKDKGREGEVVKSFPKKSTLVVKGLNIFKKHIKPSQNQPSIALLHVSQLHRTDMGSLPLGQHGGQVICSFNADIDSLR